MTNPFAPLTDCLSCDSIIYVKNVDMVPRLAERIIQKENLILTAEIVPLADHPEVLGIAFKKEDLLFNRYNIFINRVDGFNDNFPVGH